MSASVSPLFLSLLLTAFTMDEILVKTEDKNGIFLGQQKTLPHQSLMVALTTSKPMLLCPRTTEMSDLIVKGAF